MLSWHCYYFSREEFELHLAAAGLRVIARYGYSVEAFLCREHPWMARFWRSRWCREPVKRPLRWAFAHAPEWARERWAHMMMYACRAGTGASL